MNSKIDDLIVFMGLILCGFDLYKKDQNLFNQLNKPFCILIVKNTILNSPYTT
jgi:hypothetical protein